MCNRHRMSASRSIQGNENDRNGSTSSEERGGEPVALPFLANSSRLGPGQLVFVSHVGPGLGRAPGCGHARGGLFETL